MPITKILKVDDWKTMTSKIAFRKDTINKITELMTKYAALDSMEIDKRQKTLSEIHQLANSAVKVRTWGALPSDAPSEATHFAWVLAAVEKEAKAIEKAQRLWGNIRTLYTGKGRRLYNPTAPQQADPLGQISAQSKSNYWLELVDPKHRSWGHLDEANLFKQWAESDVKISFFDWVDGQGKGAHPSVVYVAPDQRWRYAVPVCNKQLCQWGDDKR